MASGKVTVVADTQTLLGAGGVFLSDRIMYEGSTPGLNEDGFTALMGFVNSDQNGTIDVYQGTPAQVNAVAIAVPAAGTGDGNMRLFTLNHVGAVNSPGTPFTVPLVSQSVVIRFTNTGGVQASFNLHGKIVQ